MKKLFIILMGIVFVGVGIFMIVRGNDLAKRCTTETTAKVVSIETEESTDSDGHYTYTYYPVFEFNAGEKTITQKGSTGSSRAQYKIGDSVELLYDANKPEDFIVKGDKTSNILGIIFVVAGVFVTGVGVIKSNF